MKQTDDRKLLDSGESKTDAERSNSQFSRRRFTKAGLAAPAILSLSSRPAFGAVCSPSGFVSNAPNNPSGVRHQVSGCGGYSPGAWKNPDSGNGDGSRAEWYAAGFFPNPRDENDPDATLFLDVFGVPLDDPDSESLHDAMLNQPGSLEFHTVAALLNSKTIPGYMNTFDVVGLYQANKAGLSYTTAGGVTIPYDFDLKAFIEQTYH